MTDHPCAGTVICVLRRHYAVKAGMPYEAGSQRSLSTLRRSLIDDRYGSLTAGKTADFTLFSGDPFDYRSRVRLFVGGGAVKYDPEGLVSGAKDRV
jgi:imidazolonepropionase-like amidohydrolase